MGVLLLFRRLHQSSKHGGGHIFRELSDIKITPLTARRETPLSMQYRAPWFKSLLWGLSPDYAKPRDTICLMYHCCCSCAPNLSSCQQSSSSTLKLYTTINSHAWISLEIPMLLFTIGYMYLDFHSSCPQLYPTDHSHDMARRGFGSGVAEIHDCQDISRKYASTP